MKPNLENINLVKNDLTDELYNYYSKCNLIAVDCEMMGLNPLRDRLCLVQMCDESEKITLVKVEQKTNGKSPMAPNLKKLFEDSKIKKIFHFARADLAFLNYHLGIEIKNVFCTRSASKLVRTYTDKHGLKEILKELFNLKIDKDTQSTDWGQETLTKDQIEYAATDVIHLISLYKKLVEMLKRENRLELLEEANRFLPSLVKLDLLGYVDFFAH